MASRCTNRNNKATRVLSADRYMLVLRKITDIHTTAKTAYHWFEQLEQHYHKRHSDHIACQWENGSMAMPGSTLELEENLHGRLHRLRLKITEVVPGELVRYRIAPGLSGTFRFPPT